MWGWAVRICSLVYLAGMVHAADPAVGLIKIDGAIGPATSDYIARAVKVSAAQKHECLIIQLDTPGGLLDSTKTIVQTLFASPVPTVVYVAPAGAHAASAGCFITLAADVAAMAPSTSIGAAHPVVMGGSGTPGTNDVMGQKLENFAAGFIETIAQKRDRNVEWAIQSVRESATLTAEKALEQDVIEIVAEDIPALLQKLDQFKLADRTLETAGASVVELPMLARERVFQMFWRPEVMFILMLVAIYGIIGEVTNPGTIIPGVTGVVALLISLYMMAVLPVNIVGILLLLLAIGLFIAEVFTPTFGILTAAGIVAFLIGGLMLFDSPIPEFRLSLAYILPAALLTAAFFALIIGAGLKAQFRPVRVGRETMIGQKTTASTPINAQSGRVFIEGENWRAVSDVPIAQGQEVEIVSIQGLTLKVKPAT